MPKERFSLVGDEALEVRWNKNEGIIDIVVEQDEYFSFHHDQELQEIPEYTSLMVSLHRKGDVDRLIRVLKKARKHLV